VNTVMTLRVPYKAENLLSSLATVSFSIVALFHAVRHWSTVTPVMHDAAIKLYQKDFEKSE
jgi:hypothetical protein